MEDRSQANESERRSDSADRVVAVVTAFRPDRSLLEHCELLRPQVRTIIVVDDGSGAEFDGVLSQLEGRGIRVERQPENRGIARAINRGFSAAAELGAEFVVTFDQDSRVGPAFIDALVAEFDRAKASGLRVGMVAPEFFAGAAQTDMPQNGAMLQAYQPIQSGLLMPLETILRIGPQRDDYFIDLVDTEYYLRLISRGQVAVCVPHLDMPHSLGHRLSVRFLGRPLRRRDGSLQVRTVSSPFRYYYRARNRIVLNREYFRENPYRAQMFRDTLKELAHYALAVQCCRGKAAFLSILFAGWRDGLRGRMGKIPDATFARSRRVMWKHPI